MIVPTKKSFIKLMPDLDIPEECLLSKVKYPTALLSAFENEKEKHSLLDVLCEKMLRHPLEKITIETLLNEVKDKVKDKVKKISSSKTTLCMSDNKFSLSNGCNKYT